MVGGRKLEPTDPNVALAADVRHFALDPARRLYAVFDGAQFEDLPEVLSQAALAHRSLYVGVDDPALVDVGPWLIDFRAASREPDNGVRGGPDRDENDGSNGSDLSDEALQAEADRLANEMRAALEAGDETGGGMLPRLSAPPSPELLATRIDDAVALLADCPNAAVFWIGDTTLTPERMWRHARSLNRVLIPAEFVPDDDGGYRSRWAFPEDDPEGNAIPLSDSNETWEAVLFRHADGNVLAEILPHLTAEQFARVFGPAVGMTFLSPDHPSERSGSSLRRAMRPADVAPVPASGLLRLTAEQMKAIENGRLRRIHRDAVANLLTSYEEAPPDTVRRRMWDDAWRYVLEAASVGVEDYDAFEAWVWMQWHGQGHFSSDPVLWRFMQDGVMNDTWHHPDERVFTLYDFGVAKREENEIEAEPR